MRFIDLKLFLLLFACVAGAVVYESPIRSRALIETRDPWNIAIAGQGYFQINEQYGEDGCTTYTRAGNLQINANGELYLPLHGKIFLMEPMISIPQDWKSVRIADDGSVFVTQPGTSAETNVGQIQLAKFQINNAFADDYIANQLTDKQGQPSSCNPGTVGTGQILQGWLETPPESVLYRYAKPILIGSVIAVVLKLLLDSIAAQQKVQRLWREKMPPGELH